MATSYPSEGTRPTTNLEPQKRRVERMVTEYDHRYVFAQINGPKINALLDLEPIRPGEDEGAAALRLLGRVRRIYGPRFFDVITADAWYAKGPFLRAVDQLGWAWVVALKREDMEVFQEARQLSQGQNPAAAFEDTEQQTPGAIVGSQRAGLHLAVRPARPGRPLRGKVAPNPPTRRTPGTPSPAEPLGLGRQRGFRRVLRHDGLSRRSPPMGDRKQSIQ